MNVVYEVGNELYGFLRDTIPSKIVRQPVDHPLLHYAGGLFGLDVFLDESLLSSQYKVVDPSNGETLFDSHAA